MVDECLPHRFVKRLGERGYPDSVHPIHIGMRGRDDHLILARALDEDRIVITNNAKDYRDLLAKEPIHPGAIMLPNAELEESWRLLQVALSFIELQLVPADYMVNRVIEVSARDGIRPYELPAPEAT